MIKTESVKYLGPAPINYSRSLHAGKSVNYQQTYGFSDTLIAIGNPLGYDASGTQPIVEIRTIDNTFIDRFTGPTNSNFGAAVAISGNRIVISAPTYTGAGYTGSIFVYDLDADYDPAVGRQPVLEISNPGTGADYGNFAWSVAANSSRIAFTTQHLGFLYDFDGNLIGQQLLDDETTETAFETGLPNAFWSRTDRRNLAKMNEDVVVFTYNDAYPYPVNSGGISGTNQSVYGDWANFRTIQGRLYIYDMQMQLIKDCTVRNADGTGGKWFATGCAVTADRIYATGSTNAQLFQMYVFNLSGDIVSRFHCGGSLGSVAPTLSANQNYICVGETSIMESDWELTPGRRFTYFSNIRYNNGGVYIYDLDGRQLLKIQDTRNFLDRFTETRQVGWVTHINSKNQLLIDGFVSDPMMIDLESTPGPSSVGQAVESSLNQTRSLFGKGSYGTVFQQRAGSFHPSSTGTTYNVNIATLTNNVQGASIDYSLGYSVFSDGAKIFRLGGGSGGSQFVSSVRVYSPTYDVSAITPSNYTGTTRQASPAVDDGKIAAIDAGISDFAFGWTSNDSIRYNMLNYASAIAGTSGIDTSGTDRFYKFYRADQDIFYDNVFNHMWQYSNAVATDGSRYYIQESTNQYLKLRNINHSGFATQQSSNNHLSGNRFESGATCDGAVIIFAGGGTTQSDTIDYISINLAGNSTTIGNLAQSADGVYRTNLNPCVITDMSRAVMYVSNNVYPPPAQLATTYFEYTNISTKANAATFSDPVPLDLWFKGSSTL